ncbi:MAG TPA: DUF1329 domain-containing protein [Candidatus Binatia bacterium]|jgi:hypothetical protein
MLHSILSPSAASRGRARFVLSTMLAAAMLVPSLRVLADDDSLDGEKHRVPAHIGTPAASGGVAEPVIPAGAKGGEVKPGDKIDKTNAERVKDLVSPGVRWCVENGMEINVVPYEKIPVPADYQAATEKYSPQVKLGKDNTVENWVAGKPFPVIDNNDPQAAQKIMYNFERTHYFTETLDLNLTDADTGALYIDANGNRHYNVERHFVPEWLRIFRYEGRIKHPPMKVEPNNDRTFHKAGLYPLIEPFDLKGVGGVSFRYQDQARQDDTWLYLPFVRRVRRMSSTQRSDALFGQDIDVDSFGGYAGQIPWFEWKLLGEKPLLMSMHGQRLPPQTCKSDGGMTFCEPWEVRPSVYIVQGKSKFPGYAYSSRVIYVDKESNIIGYSDLQDPAGQLWKTVMISFRVDKKPNPKVNFTYDEPRMFAYAYSVIDTQLMHGTRVAIPGMAFQNEAGWYLDLGYDAPTSVSDDWFTIASLIKAGR